MVGPQQGKPRFPDRRRAIAKPQNAGGAGPGAARPQAQPQSNNKVINRQITSAAEAGDSSRLFEKIQLYLHDMNGINLATAFHRVAKLVSGGVLYQEATKQHPVFQELFQAIVHHITCHSLRNSDKAASSEATWEMPVQCMSIVNWSCATLQLRHKVLCAAIAEISAPRLNEFKPYELSNLLWAFAKLSFSPCDLFKNVTTRLLRRQEGEFKVQCLSTIAWSFATMKRRILVVFTSLAKELVAHAHEMKPQEISNALWAFAKSRCANVDLFQALGDAAATDSAIWSFKPQELSNTAWAFATMGLQHPTLFALIEKVSIRKRHEMVPQNIANILWSFAKLQVQPSSDLYPLLLETAERALPQHKPQELSAVVWAAAQACPHGHAGFFAAAAQCCTARLQDTQEFSMNGLANLVKAFAVVDMDAPEIFVSLIRVSVPMLPQFKPLALCGLFSGLIRATSNLSYSSHTAEITRAVAQVALHVSLHVHKFQPFELQEVADAIASSRLGEEVEGLKQLEQEVARARLRLPESSEAKGKGGQSVGSMSTSAEESGEDEDDDFAWSSSAHSQQRSASHHEAKAVGEVPAEKAAYSWAKPAAFEAAAPSLGGLFNPSFISVPPGLGLAPETPAAWAQDSSQGWTPWHVPLLAPPAVASLPPGLAASSAEVEYPNQLPVDASAPARVSLEENATPVHEGGDRLDTLDVGAFVEVGSDLAMKQVSESWLLAQRGSVYGVEEHVYLLHNGSPQERVVIKRVATSLATVNRAAAQRVLQPVAQVEAQGCHFLVYPHCIYGNLAEWLSSRAAAGLSMRPSEAARVVRDVLTAAEALMSRDIAAVGVVQPDQIFVCEGGVPRLREPLAGKPGGWQDGLKWLSPDEAAGRMQSVESTWPALSFRLGMLLYCMGSGNVDPYPGISGEVVLMSLLSEVPGGKPCQRPDMAAYGGPEILRRMVAACLQIDGQAPPARSALVAVLDAITREAQQYEPMKVSAAAP